MTITFPKTCGLCGARALPGTNRCADHATDSGRPGVCEFCGARTAHGPRCADHPATEAERLARFPYRKQYSSPAYRHNRLLAYERDKGLCQRCGRPVPIDDFQSDHIIPVVDGGSDEVSNLQTMHPRGCHPKKTAGDRRRRREQGGRA